MSEAVFVGKTFTAPKARYRHFTNVVLRYADVSQPWRILDVGCGTGEQLFDLARVFPKASFTGVDISEANIQGAERTRNQLAFDSRIAFVIRNYLDFQVDPFDIILSDSTLQNIAASTASLYTKIATDLLPGGLLFTSMPYACLYNHVLWAIRRLCGAVQGSYTDAMLLTIAKYLYHTQFSEPILRQRIPYMYLLPQRYDSRVLRRLLDEVYGLQYIDAHAVVHTSVAQPKHRLIVSRKRE
jgi:trans-aconitate methyltransferase